MQSLMMKEQLSIVSIMKHAEINHGSQKIISLTSDGRLHRFNYKAVFLRVRKLANALDALGVTTSDRVATMAWNDHRHFELYYAISCIGAVCHTINPRLFKDQIAYIASHAEGKYLFLDVDFAPLVESIEAELTSVKGFIILCDKTEMPDTSLSNAVCYETLIENQSNHYEWPDIPEETASSLCYTSGTTGNPKGVLYSHRSNVLHAYACVLPDAMCLSANDTVLPVVPMYHANSWGLNYSAPMVGAKLVLPGSKAGSPAVLTQLMNEEGVTFSAGVPTVWLALLNYLSDNNETLTTLQRTIVGGAACPSAIIEEFSSNHGVEVIHAWGMTELSPLGTIFAPKTGYEELTEKERSNLKSKQGRAIYGIQLKIVDAENQELPWDGKSFGLLKVKGIWVSGGYYLSEENLACDTDGWFETGDVATIDKEGYMKIVDRAKDVIKSGGEWISSIELESVAQGHELVKEVAVIGIPDSKWTERPALIVVLNDEVDENQKTQEDIRSYMVDKVPTWWIPEQVIFINELPHTATGKVSKLELRIQFS